MEQNKIDIACHEKKIVCIHHPHESHAKYYSRLSFEHYVLQNKMKKWKLNVRIPSKLRKKQKRDERKKETSHNRNQYQADVITETGWKQIDGKL